MSHTTSVPLLNPQHDSELAWKMLTVTEEHMTRLATTLTTAVLDRETYLLTVGAHIELRKLRDQLRHIYRKEIHT